jgi:hypothetical protein
VACSFELDVYAALCHRHDRLGLDGVAGDRAQLVAVGAHHVSQACASPVSLLTPPSRSFARPRTRPVSFYSSTSWYSPAQSSPTNSNLITPSIVDIVATVSLRERPATY